MDLVTAFFAALGCCFGASILNVFMSWLILFRSADFRNQCSELGKKREQLEEINAKGDYEDKGLAKKKKRLEGDIASLEREIGIQNMKYNMVSGLTLFMINRWCRSVFQGIVVARIPFEPFSFLTRLTHSGIETEDYHDGSFQFVYWMGSLLFRDTLTKIFGTQLPQIGLSSQFKQ